MGGRSLLSLLPFLVVECGLAFPLHAAIVHPPEGNDPQGHPNLIKHADCKGVTPGGTDLLNDGAVTPLDVAGTWNSLKNDVQNQFGANWKYAVGTSLGGDLYVDTYQAFDIETAGVCAHSAELLCHYENITAPAGKTLGWIQVYKKSGQSQDPPGYGDPHAGASFDPPPNATFPSGKVADTVPLYHNQGEKHYHDVGFPDEAIFWDLPTQTHTDAVPWEGGNTYYLFLVSWDGSYDSSTEHTITLHDAFSWGFTGKCTAVPDPAAVPLLLPPLALLMSTRRRRTRGRVLFGAGRG